MFKETLAKIMEKRDIKAAQLSQLSGVSEASISEYLSGKKEPMGKTLNKLAKVLDVSMDTLLETEWATPIDELDKEKPATTEGSGLNDSQRELLDLILKMTPEDREEAINYIRYLLSRKEGQGTDTPSL